MINFKTEVEMCQNFIEWAQKQGYQVFEEVKDTDILLIKNDEQLGIQAKLKPTIKLLDQALTSGPPKRALLVPFCKGEFRTVVQNLGLGLFCLVGNQWFQYEEPKRIFASKELKVPQFKHLETKAGQPSPKPLTPWRMKSIILSQRLKENGQVTSLDFKELKLNKPYWLEKFLDFKKKEGKISIYVQRPGTELPDEGWVTT